MKVWVVISGYAYESSEVIQGVYLNEASADAAVNKFKSSESYRPALEYCYAEECEVLE